VVKFDDCIFKIIVSAIIVIMDVVVDFYNLEYHLVCKLIF